MRNSQQQIRTSPSKLDSRRPQEIKIPTSAFIRIKNKITQSQRKIERNTQSIDPKSQEQINTKSQEQIYNKVSQKSQSINLLIDQNDHSQSRSLLQTPRLSHRRTDSKDFTKKLKLKDYIRLNQISREKRSQSSSSNKLRSLNKLKLSVKQDLRTTFGKHNSFLLTQLSVNVQKRSSRPYGKQIQLQKGQLLSTVKKTRQRFQKVMKLIEQTGDKYSNYNDLVFMFNVEEIMNNFVIKGLQDIDAAYSQHFCDDDSQLSIKNKLHNKSPIKSKSTLNISPALRAQKKALEEIYLLSCDKKDTKLPVTISMTSIVSKFNDNQPVTATITTSTNS